LGTSKALWGSALSFCSAVSKPSEHKAPMRQHPAPAPGLQVSIALRRPDARVLGRGGHIGQGLAHQNEVRTERVPERTQGPAPAGYLAHSPHHEPQARGRSEMTDHRAARCGPHNGQSSNSSQNSVRRSVCGTSTPSRRKQCDRRLRTQPRRSHVSTRKSTTVASHRPAAEKKVARPVRVLPGPPSDGLEPSPPIVPDALRPGTAAAR